MGLIRNALNFAGFNEKRWHFPERFIPYRYSLTVHGVGMANEWPVIVLHPNYEGSMGGRFEAGQVICVESLIGAEGTKNVRLEAQVLVTKTGVERLNQLPWEM